MESVNVKGKSSREAKQKAEVLQFIADELSNKEIDRLGKIARSENARQYLNGKYGILKMSLSL